MSNIPDFLRKNALYVLLILLPVLSVAMHWRAFHADLLGVHVWRQAQTQAVIINFFEEDFNILNPRLDVRGSGDGVERKEFPLMQWLFAGAYKVFGKHLVLTRLLTFVVGLSALLGMFFLIKNLFGDSLAALAGAWALHFSPAFFYYMVNPLPDNFALCCSIWGLAFFFHWYARRGWGALFAAGFFISLAALCKLPFVIYFVVPFVCFAKEYLRKKAWREPVRGALTMAIFLIPPVAWYAWVIPTWQGTDVVGGILDNRFPMSRLLRFVFDNLVSTLPEMLLNYAAVPFFAAGFYFAFKRKAYRDGRFALLVALSAAALLYFFYEINMIANVHDYYLFPFVPLLFILVSYGAMQMLGGGVAAQRVAVFLLLLMPLTAYLRTRNSWNPDSPGFNKDWLLHKKELREAAPDSALCVVGNDDSYQIFFYHINKKGWAFAENRLTPSALKGMVNEGAQYLYSDTRQVDEQPALRPLLDSLVLERGTVRVFRLRKEQ
ncbi:MAG: glycosyltransferase family 39 protein [Saprospiraceae bacterium]|nr:glycosyltransferase family 39 protein [Saprospiraceae bacterium]